jgi:GABA permease
VLTHWREAGLSAQGVVGDPDPAVAVQETWDPRRFDEVIVSTLPGRTSKWLQSDLPHRVQQITGCNVVHVEAGGKREPKYQPVPERDRDDLGLFRLHAQKDR